MLPCSPDERSDIRDEPVGMWHRIRATSYNYALQPSQRYRFHDVIGALLQDQRRARPGRQDVVLEVGKIGPVPDRQRGRGGLVVRQQRVAMEIGSRIVE